MTTLTADHLTDEQIETLGAELDALRAEVVASLGERDARYIHKIIRTQRGLDATARALLLFAKFPPAWIAGTAALSVAKILENMELGHNIMHGQWDWMRDPKIHSTTWEWDHACAAEGWKKSHNFEHHTYTNVLGKDRDLGYSIMRVSRRAALAPGPPDPAGVQPAAGDVLRVGRRLLRPRGGPGQGRQEVQEGLPARPEAVLAQGPPPAREGLRALPGAVGRVRTAVGGGQHGRELRREPRAQLLGARGDLLRALPRGRRDLPRGAARGRDPRAVVRAADDGLGEPLRAARCSTP